jgi:hypothetical protein
MEAKVIVVMIVLISAIVTSVYAQVTWSNEGDVLPTLSKVLFVPMWFVGIYGAITLALQSGV